MNWRNAKKTRDGKIDVELEHPSYGWVPFTIDPADKGAEFDVAELYRDVMASGNVAEFVPPAPTPVEPPRDPLVETVQMLVDALPLERRAPAAAKLAEARARRGLA